MNNFCNCNQNIWRDVYYEISENVLYCKNCCLKVDLQIPIYYSNPNTEIFYTFSPLPEDNVNSRCSLKDFVRFLSEDGIVDFSIKKLDSENYRPVYFAAPTELSLDEKEKQFEYSMKKNYQLKIT